MKTMKTRTVFNVCSDILYLKKWSFTDKNLQHFHLRLKDLRELSIHSAPEEPELWKELQEIVQGYIPEPTEEWHYKTLSFLSGNSAESIKEFYKEMKEQEEFFKS